MKTFDEAFRLLKAGQKKAILRNVARATDDESQAEEIFRAIQAGELKIQLVDGVVKLVDHTGRCIPGSKIKARVVDANRNFYLDQPTIDYTSRLQRLMEFFGKNFAVSVNEFEERSNALIEEIKSDRRVANILSGVHLPIAIPRTSVGDYGTTLESEFLPAVQRAYESEFPNRKFNNYRKNKLTRNVTIAEGSRHERLIKAMADRPQVGIYFPTALQGFSIPADREQIAVLPDGFMLAGAIDTATTITGYADVLAWDWHTPGLDCAANSRSGSANSLCFLVDDDELDFNGGGLDADEDCSGGLLFFR